MSKFNKPEDLIGTTHHCFWCNKDIVITEKGISHFEKNHWIEMSLQDLFDQKVAYEEFERKEVRRFLYGE